MISASTTIEPLLRQRQLRRLRVAMVACVGAELWVLPQVTPLGAQWMHGAFVLPVTVLIGVLVWTHTFQRVAAPLGALVLGLVAASLTASLAWVDEMPGLLVVLAAAGLALPATSGVGVLLGAVVGLSMLAGGMVVLGEVGGIHQVPVVATAWAGAVGVGVALGVHGERTERADVAAKAELQASRNALMWQVHTDPLTGLPNRGYVQQWLERSWARGRASGGHVSVLVVDIDRFKRVNDMFGHAVGDDVIRCVGRALLRSAGPTDLVGRWGGEEFVVVLEDCEPEHVADVAETMRGAVAASPVIVEGEELAVTVSIGAASWDARESLTAAELFVRADRALYKAKDEGRNLVRGHSSLPA